MKIFLEAFVDNNFGDNLFVHIITQRYKQHTFYMLPKSEYKESYDILSTRVDNIQLIEEKKQEYFMKDMDAMIMVGGDMFGNGGDYSNLIRQTSYIKRKGGLVAFLGISLFADYGCRTKLDLIRLFSKADIIVVRESTTYKQLKKMVPWVKVTCAADMVFSLDIEKMKDIPICENLLGMSVRRKGRLDDSLNYRTYCENMAEIAVKYLNKSEKNKVRFLAFSTGRFDDRKVVEDIMTLCPSFYRARISCCSFEGDIYRYITEIQECSKLVCTRFHAMILAILLKKAYVPIVYEEKMERVLNEIGYQGIRFKYEDTIDTEAILNTISSDCYSKDKMESYLEKAGHFFDGIDAVL